jgi:superfamily II DNA/RNA helicase
MSTSSTPTPDADRVHPDRLLEDALHRVWGFSSFRPLQREAMHAILDSRDSVVVLPTGGGKSLCFQAPALVPNGPPRGGHDGDRRRHVDTATKRSASRSLSRRSFP